jgi:hypothetical protein
LADPSIPQITLEEMMDELVIDDVEMGDAWNGCANLNSTLKNIEICYQKNFLI